MKVYYYKDKTCIIVFRTPGKPGTPGILLEFYFVTCKTWKTWNFTRILLEFLASVLQKLFTQTFFHFIESPKVTQDVLDHGQFKALTYLPITSMLFNSTHKNP